MSKGKRKKRRRAERRAVATAGPPAKTTTARGSRSASPLRWVEIGGVLVVALAIAWYVIERRSSETDPSNWVIPDPDSSEMAPPVARSIATVRDAVVRQPDLAAAWGRLGSVFDAHGLFDLAVVCYEHAQELEPTNFRWPYLLGMVYDFQGEDLDKILGSFETAIRLRPGSPVTYFRYGDALMRQGTLERARDAFLKALELKSDLALAHRSLGQVHLALDDPTSAVRHLERAAEQSPQDPVVFSTLARAYKMLDQEGLAWRAAKMSGTVKGTSPLPDTVRAEVENLAVDPMSCARRAERLMGRGKFAEAIHYLKLFEEASPDHPHAHFQLGTAYLRVGQPDLAVTHLARAVDLKSDLIPARFQLASLHQSRGQPSAAIEQLNGVLAHEPDNARARAMLALVLGTTGDLDAEIEPDSRTEVDQ